MKFRTQCLLAFATLATCAFAADFPAKDKVITIVVPFAAGGPTDRVARDLSEAMRKPLGGISIVVDNAAGAGGSIGANKVAKASPDGYTLLLHHIGMSVPSLEEGRRFYVDVLGFEELGIGEFARDPDIDRILGLENSAGRSAYLRLGDAKIEMFEFSAPAQAPGPTPARSGSPTGSSGAPLKRWAGAAL